MFTLIMDSACTLPLTSRDNGEVLNQDEKEKFIEENLAYIGKFFTNVKNVEHRLPTSSKNRLQEFRDAWCPFLSLAVKSGSTMEQKKTGNVRAVAVNWERGGAVPKRRAGRVTQPGEKNSASEE
jgi:hypothetical protein